MKQNLQDLSQKEILEAIELIEEYGAQRFPFNEIESFLDETRVTELVAILGFCAELIKRFREQGMTVDEADRAATTIGVHPSLIWPQWTSVIPISDYVFDEVEEFMASNKLCPKCELWQPRDEYHKRAAAKDGLARFCRPCMKQYDRDRVRSKR